METGNRSAKRCKIELNNKASHLPKKFNLSAIGSLFKALVFQTLTLPAMAVWLIATVKYVPLRKYRKHPRGAKQSPAKRTCDPQQPHVPAV
ncbi:MAG TPA: hypothetical protein PK820_15405 [Candidatus Competibacteraceae bacterium]|nr:hypothetical protein [Candidatus Competibacteraceae bacterium]